MLSGSTFPLHANPMFLRKEFINGAFPLGTPYHEDVDFAAFCAIHKGLSDVAVDDEAACLHNLAELVLSVVVDVYFHPIYPGGDVIA